MKQLLFSTVILFLLAAPVFGETVIDSQECARLGGEVINTLSDECGSDDKLLGKVKGLRCPCVCCAKNKATEVHTVKLVLDGNTLELESGQIVRLIGINPPLDRVMGGVKVHLKSQQEDLLKVRGEQRPKKFLKQMVQGAEVRLEFDIKKIDDDGKLLAYVFIDYPPNMKVDLREDYHYGVEDKMMHNFINASMIKGGYAKPIASGQNVKYIKLFANLYKESRQKKRGLWHSSMNNPRVSCTMEAKQCSDGSYVGRIPPDCKFKECPQ